MTKRASQVPADPHRKAKFREIARSIVAKDRYNRKYGLAVDTAGAIAGALERAYRQGLAGSQPDRQLQGRNSETGPLDWALIPPRPRNAFWSICLATFGHDGMRQEEGYLVPTVTQRGTAGWQLIVSGKSYDDRPIAERTMVPLARLGLIEAAADDTRRLTVSKHGQETWRLFNKRGGRFPDDLTDL
ncbi:hypothetical protein EOA25_30035 [Mesorhizobium sp. M2A.F.Ca.ET.040.01.1.1]|nr:hypothetical protein EOA25_30035 [Mesorhizobium sp. M2A.F.Ca.ET.040.01.1.1]